MLASERRNKIYEKILIDEVVIVNDLAEKFNVSTMTIRRDLDSLEKQGVLSKTYGGAVLNKGLGSEPAFTIKSEYAQTAKAEIGYHASLLVEEGESIILDCGTTALQVAKSLLNINITVITNSWAAVSYLSKKENIKIILAPGQYDRISKGSISLDTVDYFNKFHVDKAFISTQGFSIKEGLSVPNPTDARLKSTLLKRAKNKILLLDDSKWDSVCMSKFADVSDLDLIIVNKETNSEVVKKLREHCEVYVAR